MILSRFFKPKWQHPNPQTRKQALQALVAEDPVLAAVARQDSDPEVRRAALARLAEPGLLRERAAQDADGGVREFAATRLRELLAGKVPDSPPLPARLAALQALDAATLEHLAVQGKEPELRLAVLARVENDALLGEMTLNDPSAEVRFAALERVREPATLEHLAKAGRNRDKRVTRRVRELLEAVRVGQQRAERIASLCGEMEALVWDGESGLNAARYPRLDKDWQALEADADAHSRERYQQARARFLAQRQASAAKRAARLQRCAALERLLEDLQTEVEWTAELGARIQQTLAAAQADQEPSASAGDGEGRRLEQRFAQLVQAGKDRERLLQRNHERAGRLRALWQQAEALLAQPSEVLAADLEALRQQWASLERPETRSLALELQARFDTVLERLRSRLHRQVEQRGQELADLEALLGSLEQALAAGELQQAIGFHERARDRLQHTISLSRQQMTALGERLQASAQRLGELRGWRRWGTQQAREHLCEDAERLVGLADGPEEIIRQIKHLRTLWKSLEGADDAAARTLWKRFDAACERAYQPCQAHFDAQAREREENLGKRQVVCERLEQFEAHTDWERVDWPAADRLQREAQNQWRKLGAVPRAQQKEIQRRFEKALRHLDARLQTERERELHRRQSLIEHVQAQAAAGDARAAVETAKQAQAAWHPTVQASRREEQALWRQFRAACDAVFARRQAEQREADVERQINLARKTALCEELEGLTAGDSAALGEARTRVQEAQAVWTAVGPVPRGTYKALEQRFAAACERLEERERDQEKVRREEEMQGLRQRALLCARLEALLEGQEPAVAVVAEAQHQWATLGPWQTVWTKTLQQRFDAVCQALLGGAGTRQSVVQRLEANRELKRTLCLRMEILAGVESPAEFAQARMEQQISRLSDSLSGGSAVAADENARDTEAQWYLAGLLPAALNQALEVRFQRALAALNP